MQVYLVGGAVRDRLLGLPVKERDWVVVGATPGEMRRLGFKQVGKDFPVFLHPETGEEYALARTERKIASGYTGFECKTARTVTLEEDLQRRDLTINAMAQTLDDDVIDPFGGRQDLKDGLLRHVSPAFVEDPVRILRVARFATRFPAFSVAPDTLTLMQEMVRAGEVDALVPERIWKELDRALGEAHPERFFEVLRTCGALQRIFPELDRLFGVPQLADQPCAIDTGEHTLRVLKQAVRLSLDRPVRFAALVHELGKGLTPRELWPQHKGHEQRGVELVKPLCGRLRTPKRYRDLALLVTRYSTRCHHVNTREADALLEILEALDAWRRPRRFEHFLLACEADFKSQAGFEQQVYPPADALRQALQAASRVAIQPLIEQGLKGKQFAQALQRLRSQAIAQGFLAPQKSS
jgi:tRNA nucleotidyltransferase (CCA-adding enzyme)